MNNGQLSDLVCEQGWSGRGQMCAHDHGRGGTDNLQSHAAYLFKLCLVPPSVHTLILDILAALWELPSQAAGYCAIGL